MFMGTLADDAAIYEEVTNVPPSEPSRSHVDRLRAAESLGDTAADYQHFWYCQMGVYQNLPVVHHSRAVQAHYVAMRLDGTSHNLAEMLALQVPPQPQSDREFLLANRQGREDQFEGAQWRGDFYRHRGEAAGASTGGSVYLPGLARFPGDPEAWVDGLGDVRRVVERRGWSCEGVLNIKGVEPDNPPEPAPIADDIVHDRACALIDANPDLAPVAEAKPQEFMERARETLAKSYTWDKPYLQD